MYLTQENMGLKQKVNDEKSIQKRVEVLELKKENERLRRFVESIPQEIRQAFQERAVCQSSPAIAIFSRKEVHLGGRKKLTNNTGIPQHRIEAIARCILPDILAFYESEEGQREFAEWKKPRELEKQEIKAE